MCILKSNINYVNWVVLYLWCLNINYVNWVVLYLWSLNINYVDEFSLYLWRWNVIKIHTGKLWVFQETLSLGSNTLINFFIIFQETLLFGRHFHSELQSIALTLFLKASLPIKGYVSKNVVVLRGEEVFNLVTK